MTTRDELIRRKRQNQVTKSHRDDLFSEFMIPFDRLFDDIFKTNFPAFQSKYGANFFEKGSYPKVDILDKEDSIQIEAAVPGMSKDEISIEIHDGILTISGEKISQEKESGRYIYRELKRSSFRRSWTLNDNFDEERIEAIFENGMLYLTIPKINIEEKKKIRQIEIK